MTQVDGQSTCFIDGSFGCMPQADSADATEFEVVAAALPQDPLLLVMIPARTSPYILATSCRFQYRMVRA